MKFEEAVEIVLEIEGGGKVTLHPLDPGGLTKWGISLRAYPHLGAAGIQNLSKEDAIALYWKDYWVAMHLRFLPPRLRLPLFDAAVNHGIKNATKIFQRALNELGAQLVIDGILGEKTLKAAKVQKCTRLLVEFIHERLKFYRSLETYQTFGRGWEKRVLVTAISA